MRISPSILLHTVNFAPQNSPKYAISRSQQKFMRRGHCPSPHPTPLGSSSPNLELALMPLEKGRKESDDKQWERNRKKGRKKTEGNGRAGSRTVHAYSGEIFIYLG